MDVIKQIAWNTFKNTGDINTFLELVEVENIEKNIYVPIFLSILPFFPIIIPLCESLWQYIVTSILNIGSFFKTKGIILRESNMGDFDKMLTMV